MEAISGSYQVNGEPEKRTSDTTEGRLKYFIEFFIKCFEGKSDEFGWEARIGGVPSKGKICGMMPESIVKPSAAAAIFFGAPGWVATTVGVSYSLFKKPITNFLRKSHRKKAKTLASINVEYGPSTIRGVLAEAAASIFYSFQTQLIAIYDQDGLWWRGLEKFAIDARDRIIDYLTQDKAFDMNISCSILVKALLQGQSKQSIMSYCRLGKAGRTIKLKNVDEKTESLFEVAGVKRFDDSGEITYYIKKGLEPKHERYDHEFRYLLKWEEASDWQNMYEKATDIIAAKATTINVTQDELKQYILIRFLIETGADKNCETEGGSKIIHWLAQECNNSKILELFGESKEMCEEKNNCEWTPLHCAANYGNLEAVIFLAEKKVDPHLCDDNECEPIEYALHNGRLEIVQFFLAHGDGWLDVNARFRNTLSPIHLAVLSGNAALVRFLIENGADKNCETEYGMKAIHYAARDRNCEILKLFGESKEQCEQKDHDGWTPLHYAIAYGNLEAATFLIEMKVDPHPCDNEGFKPVEYAIDRGKRKIVELFNQLDGRE